VLGTRRRGLIFSVVLSISNSCKYHRELCIVLWDIKDAIFMQDIDIICEALPALEVLNLTNNLMERDFTMLPSLKHIRILVLNNCNTTWEEVILYSGLFIDFLTILLVCQFMNCYKFVLQQVEKLKQSLHAIEELHLMANQLGKITVSTETSSFCRIVRKIFAHFMQLKSSI